MNQSYWQDTTSSIKCEKVTEDLEVDIVIIGAGLAGVSLAYQLKDLPYRVVVVERGQVGFQTSGHTTAKITSLHGQIYQLLKKHYDIHYAHLYFLSQESAIQEIREIVQKEHIDCDFYENDAYLYTDDPQYVSLIQEIENILKSFRVETISDSQHLASIGLKHQAVFHPLKYLYQLVKICQKSGVKFYEYSQVSKVKRKHYAFEVKVGQYQIQCQYVVHATRYPFIKKGMYFAKLFQTKENIDCRLYDGNSSRLCIDQSISYRPINQKGLYIDIKSCDWYAMDSIPLRGVPYIGEIKPHTHEYVIYGFQKWGMTLSQVAARLIKDCIIHQQNPYCSLYSCQYFSIGFAKEYQKELLQSYYKGYIGLRFHYEELNQMSYEEGKIVRIGSKLRAVYKDKVGKCHIFSPYCPHMRCILQFDQKDKIWICPCHQSTFTAFGKLIDGPSLSSMKETKENRKKKH